jgi:hypothetical protein
MPSSLDHVDCEFAKKPKFPSNGDGEHVNANANAIAKLRGSPDKAQVETPGTSLYSLGTRYLLYCFGRYYS